MSRVDASGIRGWQEQQKREYTDQTGVEGQRVADDCTRRNHSADDQSGALTSLLDADTVITSAPGGGSWSDSINEGRGWSEPTIIV
jgi:hypothetical protein